MAVRSIIEVAVDDSRFKAFQASFAKYHASLKEMAPEWDAAALATQAAAQATAEITAELEKQAKAQEKAERAAEKAEREREKAAKAQTAAQKKRLDDAKKEMAQIRDAAAGVADFLMKGTASLVKWAGIGGVLGGLIGAGGLFGLGALAGNVGDARRSAMGLGINPGQQAAFGLNFGRYVDANSNLQAIADAQNDLTKRWAFGAMGVNPAGKDPATLAAEMAQRAKALWDRGDHTQQYTDSHGLSQFYSLEDLRRLGNVSAGELAAAGSGYRRDARDLARNDATSKAWQDFNIQLRRAGSEIENSLVIGLERAHLPEALTELSASVSKAVEAFLSNPHLKDWIDEFSKGIEAVGQYLGSDKFKSDMKDFVNDIGDVATSLVAALKTLGVIKEHGPARTERRFGFNADTQGFDLKGSGLLGFITQHDRANAAYDFFRKKGWSDAAAKGIVANLLAESGLDAGKPGDHGHALGVAQWHKDRQDAFKKWSGHDLRDSTLAEQLAFVNFELAEGQFKKVGDALKAAKNLSAADAGYTVSKHYEMPRDVEGQARSRAAAAAALKVSVQVNNNTGGNANVQATQAAAQ